MREREKENHQHKKRRGESDNIIKKKRKDMEINANQIRKRHDSERRIQRQNVKLRLIRELKAEVRGTRR